MNFRGVLGFTLPQQAADSATTRKPDTEKKKQDESQLTRRRRRRTGRLGGRLGTRHRETAPIPQKVFASKKTWHSLTASSGVQTRPSKTAEKKLFYSWPTAPFLIKRIRINVNKAFHHRLKIPPMMATTRRLWGV